MANGNITGNNISSNNKSLLDDVINRLNTAKFIKVNSFKEFNNERQKVVLANSPTIITLENFPENEYITIGIFYTSLRGLWFCKHKYFDYDDGNALLVGYLNPNDDNIGPLYSVRLLATRYNQTRINQYLA